MLPIELNRESDHRLIDALQWIDFDSESNPAADTKGGKPSERARERARDESQPKEREHTSLNSSQVRQIVEFPWKIAES